MISAALLVSSIATGLVLLSLFFKPLRFEERLGIAFCLGPALLAWLSYLLSLAFGLGRATLSLVLLLFIFFPVLSLTLKKGLWASLKESGSDLLSRIKKNQRASMGFLLVALLGLAILVPIYHDVFIETASGTIETGTATNRGDAPYHVGLIHSFVYGENIPPEDTIFAGQRLRYPFMMDFGSAVLMAGGWSTHHALWIPHLIVTLSFFILFGCLTYRLTNNLLATALFLPLFLFGGGFQFVRFFQDALAHPSGFFSFLWGPWPDSYRNVSEWNLRWTNPITSLFVTQRTLPLGLSFVASIFLLLYLGIKQTTRKISTPYFIGAGLLCGLLPLLHAHQFLSLVIFLPLFSLLHLKNKVPLWILFASLVGVLALPQFLWLKPVANETASFLTWQPGWLAAKEIEGVYHFQLLPFLWFWILNLGPFVPLGLAASFLYKKLNTKELKNLLPVWILFVAPCLFLFAPWARDNKKIFIVWYAFMLIPVATLLASWLKRSLPFKFLSVSLIGVFCLSGVIHLSYVLFKEGDFILYHPSQIKWAQKIRELTEPDAVILERPHYATITNLAGRRVPMGYEGHLWTHGTPYLQREADLQALFGLSAPKGTSPETIKSLQITLQNLIDKHQIDYILLGPQEKRAFGSEGSFLLEELEVLHKEGQRVLLKTHKK